ncbi:MAG: hypothetical protein AB1798_03755 [Spirochaetota bacterium]
MKGLFRHERLALTDTLAKLYQNLTKKEKGKELKKFIAITDYNRTYASHLLSSWGKVTLVRIDGKLVRLKAGGELKKGISRPPYYGVEVDVVLKCVWEIYDYPCGKRLKAVLIRDLELVEMFQEITLTEETKRKLEHISAATIDRHLEKERKKYKIKGRSHTNPGSLLKWQVPVRTFADWNEQRPGFFEIDLVGHDGGNPKGDFCFTLMITDVCTGWSEPRAVKNRAQKWTFEALKYVRRICPIVFLGIDCDNDSTFINEHLIRYCNNERIQFTRSRPYRKNDNCFVEQKNNVIVRRTAEYFRYDTEEQLRKLNEMYEAVRLYVNFFQPSAKLIEKLRVGSKVKRSYDEPLTPYERLIAHPSTPPEVKERLERQFRTLNPAALKRKIDKCKDELTRMVHEKAQMRLHF